ncbi:MAG: hypothetical protein RR364_08815 [Lachnospiraceae bacterium]
MNQLSDIEIFKEAKGVVQQIIESIDKSENKIAFQILNQQMRIMELAILQLGTGGYVPVDEINEMTNFLVQAMENRDGVLLRDIMKYAMLDVLNQLLPEEELA